MQVGARTEIWQMAVSAFYAFLSTIKRSAYQKQKTPSSTVSLSLKKHVSDQNSQEIAVKGFNENFLLFSFTHFASL